MKPTKYIVWDLETTGFDPRDSEITEIGAMVVVDGQVVEKKSWLLNHGIEIPEKITEITGITKALLDAEGRDPKECMDEFLAMMNGVQAHLTHNGIRFDIPFLIGSITKHGVGSLSQEEIDNWRATLEMTAIDTAVIVKARKLGMVQEEGESFFEFAKRVMDVRAYGVKYNVALCVEEMEIPTEGIALHRAMADVHFTNEIYTRL